MATLEETYNQRKNTINDMYSGQKESTLAGLESAYNQNKSDMEASRAKIAPQYQTEANDLAVQYERNKRNFQTQAAANGINTGTASQEALARASEYQRDFGKLRTAEANALTEQQRAMDNLTAAYKSNVQKAISDNEYQKAAALLDEYNAEKDDTKAMADTLAKYGDFSGYTNLGYSADQTNNMLLSWLAANGKAQGDQAYISGQLDKAYQNGLIDAERYRSIHGAYPAGYAAPVAASSGGGGGGTGYVAPSGSPGTSGNGGKVDMAAASTLIKEISAIGTRNHQNQALATIAPTVSPATYDYIAKNIK